jgi:hypothetical protein
MTNALVMCVAWQLKLSIISNAQAQAHQLSCDVIYNSSRYDRVKYINVCGKRTVLLFFILFLRVSGLFRVHGR